MVLPLKKWFWSTEIKKETSSDNQPQTLNEIMNFGIHPMLRSEVASKQFWLQEYFIPKDNIVEFTKALGRLLSKNKVDLINASIRIVRKMIIKQPLHMLKKKGLLLLFALDRI